MSNTGIAERLYIAVHAVKRHVHNILEKLSLHSRLQIAAHCEHQTRTPTRTPTRSPTRNPTRDQTRNRARNRERDLRSGTHAGAEAVGPRGSTGGAAADTSATIDYLLTQLESGLRRWVGAEGYAALLSRSIALTRPSHAILATITDLGGTGALPEAGALPALDAEAGRDAAVALLAVMLQQLGGILGAPVAFGMIEQSATATPRAIARPDDTDMPT